LSTSCSALKSDVLIAARSSARSKSVLSSAEHRSPCPHFAPALSSASASSLAGLALVVGGHALRFGRRPCSARGCALAERIGAQHCNVRHKQLRPLLRLGTVALVLTLHRCVSHRINPNDCCSEPFFARPAPLTSLPAAKPSDLVPTPSLPFPKSPGILLLVNPTFYSVACPKSPRGPRPSLAQARSTISCKCLKRSFCTASCCCGRATVRRPACGALRAQVAASVTWEATVGTEQSRYLPPPSIHFAKVVPSLGSVRCR
jgi:hypothetical protein